MVTEVVQESPPARMDAPSLQRFLDIVAPGRGASVTAVRAITGGYSRLTALADVTWGDGTSERLVLRGDPPVDSGVFQSERDPEWALLEALSRSTPAAVVTPRWYDSSGEYLGCKCFVVDYFAGTSAQDIARGAADLGDIRTLFVRALAGVHATPLDTLPPEMERPADWDSYIDGVIEMIRRLETDLSDSVPSLRYIASKLSTRRPPPVPLTLVHGDAQPANVLVGADGQAIVIDWEFARIGDPREDIGHYRQMPIPPNLYQTDPESFLAQYRDLTGMSVDELNQDVVEYFLILGEARLLGQMMRGTDAVAQGQSRGVMATYLVNATSLLFSNYYNACRRFFDSPAAPAATDGEATP